MRRALTLTVGLPALAAAALILAAAVEIAFLASPASSYCPRYGGSLSYCFFPPSDTAKFMIGLSLGLTVLSVMSGIFAWRRRLGPAAGAALPGLIGVVVLFVAAVANQNPGYVGPLENPPPADYWLHDFGGWVVLAGIVLLAAACGVQVAVGSSARDRDGKGRKPAQ